jgi:protoporphyrinogen oxidase
MDYFEPVLRDADIDLFEEDAYLSGMVETFLTCGHLKEKVIFFDPTIETRLNKALETLGASDEGLNKLQEYHKAMLKIYHLLSRASGIPIRPKEL